MPEYVGIDVFANAFGYSLSYAKRLVREGKAPRHLRIGRKVLFTKEDIENWTKAHVVNPENR